MNDWRSLLQDPLPDQDWEVWYRDMFDRECPPSVEVRGRGLVKGLMELWARYLLETVRPEERIGFSRFYLRRGNSPAVEIKGDLGSALNLRRWIAVPEIRGGRSYLNQGDTRLLSRIAVVHAGLLQAGRDASEILSAATKADNQPDFERLLDSLLL